MNDEPLRLSRRGDRVTLDMSHEDYDTLMLLLGYATGAAIERGELYAALQLVGRFWELNNEQFKSR